MNYDFLHEIDSKLCDSILLFSWQKALVEQKYRRINLNEKITRDTRCNTCNTMLLAEQRRTYFSLVSYS